MPPNEPANREHEATRILADAGIVAESGGPERPSDEKPHPFDAIGGGDTGDDTREPGQPDEPTKQPAKPDTLDESEAPDDEREPGEPGETDQAEQLTEQEQTELGFRELADSAGIELAELYAVEIPLGEDGAKFTLGEIKDRARELLGVDSSRELLEQDRTSAENEKLVARQELQTVVALMGQNLSPELVAHAREELRASVALERTRTFEAIPEWKEPEVALRERSEINDFLKSYGFSTAELNNVYDHRLLKLARDSQKNQTKLRTATEQAAPVRRLPRAPGKKQTAGQARRLRRKRTIDRGKGGTVDDKISAVSELIAPRD